VGTRAQVPRRSDPLRQWPRTRCRIRRSGRVLLCPRGALSSNEQPGQDSVSVADRSASVGGTRTTRGRRTAVRQCTDRIAARITESVACVRRGDQAQNSALRRPGLRSALLPHVAATGVSIQRAGQHEQQIGRRFR
jgi:hypothetical protein